MQNRESQSSNTKRKWILIAAALFAALAIIAAAVFFYCRSGWFTLRDPQTGELYERFFVHDSDTFSIEFIHSVNKSPVTDYYEFRDHKIFVEKTVYYGFGAGVQTELEDGQKLEYGEDGSMIITGFDREIPQLIYIVGTVSDHTMAVNDGEPISLTQLCGKHSKVLFSYEPLF